MYVGPKSLISVTANWSLRLKLCTRHISNKKKIGTICGVLAQFVSRKYDQRFRVSVLLQLFHGMAECSQIYALSAIPYKWKSSKDAVVSVL